MNVLLIRGMEMPKSCSQCSLHKLWPMDDEVQCLVNRKLWNDNSERHKLCPLVSIPPHGRLIDAAALWAEINKICDRRDAGIIADLTCLQQLLSAVRHAPTIIPAEEVEA